MARKKPKKPDGLVEVAQKHGDVIKKTVTKKKFTPEFIKVAGNLSSLGFTGKDIALVLDVAPSTIEGWKTKHKDFRAACDEGMKNRVAHLAAKGQMAAIGYDYEEVVEIYRPDIQNDKKLELVEKRVHKKHKTPDAKLLEFFLVNYAPEMFMGLNKVQIETNKTNIIAGDIGAVEDQLTKLAGAFLESRKQVESKVVENGT